MAFSKAIQFHQARQNMAKVFKAFSHPARVEIYKQLFKESKLCSAQLADIMPIEQSTINDHLFKLRSIGFVNYEIKDGIPYYLLQENQIPNFIKTALETDSEIQT